MLTFKNTNIIFALLLLGMVALNFFHPISFWYYLLLFFGYTVVLFLGSYFVQSNFYTPVICSAVTDNKWVALSFDDGPAEQYTAAVLAILKTSGVPAAFFCIGKNIPGREALLTQIHQEGHLIGNHSFSHAGGFDLFSARKMLADLRQMDKTVNDCLGFRPRLFRPPYGVTNPNLAKAIAHGAYQAVGWNIRSLDTVIKQQDKLQSRILRALKPGAVILLHDTSATTLSILPGLIRAVRDQGYEFRRLDNLLNLTAYA